MRTLVSFYSSTIGKKSLVAVTGLMLFGYVFVHMLGNLQLYAGPEAINAYAAFLHSPRALPLLWGARIVLGVALLLHVTTTLQLWWRNRKGRPIAYRKRQYRESPLSARVMILSGPAIGSFMVFHILHLTTNSVGPETGTGLAGASAAASLAELGYRVSTFCYQDSARRAHSIAAQGGINAARNYQNDGDSIFRLFHDTIKGGDFRSREANVCRLAEVSSAIIDQCVAQGVPFAREYGGLLANRSFGGA